MTVELITRADLEQFKFELLDELQKIMAAPKQGSQSQWLRSQDVRKLLNISPGTLQHLRIKGTLRFTQVGSIYYYKQEDIYGMLEGDRPKQQPEGVHGQLIKRI